MLTSGPLCLTPRAGRGGGAALAAGVGASASISCRSVRLSAATFNSGGRPCACGGAHCRPTWASRSPVSCGTRCGARYGAASASGRPATRALTSTPRAAAVPWNSMDGTAERVAEAGACGAAASVAAPLRARRGAAARGAAASGIAGVSPSVPSSAAEPLKLSGCANGKPMRAAVSSTSFSRTTAAGAPSTAVVSSTKSSVPPCSASLSMATCHAGAAALAVGRGTDAASEMPPALVGLAPVASDFVASAPPGTTSRLNCPSFRRRSASCGPCSSTDDTCTLRCSSRTSASCTFSASNASASAPCPSTDLSPLTASAPLRRSEGLGVCSKSSLKSASTTADCSLIGRLAGQ